MHQKVPKILGFFEFGQSFTITLVIILAGPLLVPRQGQPIPGSTSFLGEIGDEWSPSAGHYQHFAFRLDVEASAIKLCFPLSYPQRTWRNRPFILARMYSPFRTLRPKKLIDGVIRNLIPAGLAIFSRS